MHKMLPEFATALKTAGLAKFFANCTEAHRREYLKWISEAKKPATRDARIQKSLKMLSAKQKAEAKKSHQ